MQSCTDERGDSEPDALLAQAEHEREAERAGLRARSSKMVALAVPSVGAG
tara:strand:+ start:111 stop:260 length:150 start_codon:yes stop_codon:yes gene_type:complete